MNVSVRHWRIQYPAISDDATLGSEAVDCRLNGAAGYAVCSAALVYHRFGDGLRDRVLWVRSPGAASRREWERMLVDVDWQRVLNDDSLTFNSSHFAAGNRVNDIVRRCLLANRPSFRNLCILP